MKKKGGRTEGRMNGKRGVDVCEKKGWKGWKKRGRLMKKGVEWMEKEGSIDEKRGVNGWK